MLRLFVKTIDFTLNDTCYVLSISQYQISLPHFYRFDLDYDEGIGFMGRMLIVSTYILSEKIECKSTTFV